ncbi:nodulation efficiency, NfeD-like protein [Halomonas sp. BLK-85]
MDILEMHYWWILIGLGLLLAELMTGTVLLLALSAAAFITAVAAYFNIGLTGQLVTLAICVAVFAPIAIKVIRPRLSPKGINYGSVGSGAENGKMFDIVARDFDSAPGIKIHGDFFHAQLINALPSDPPLQPGDRVIFDHFEGTTAKVTRFKAT